MYGVSMGEVEFEDLREDMNVGVGFQEIRWFCWDQRWSVEGNRCAEAPWEVCHLLLWETKEKVGLVFNLLSPNLDWTALCCTRRQVFGQSKAKTFSFQKRLCEPQISKHKERFDRLLCLARAHVRCDVLPKACCSVVMALVKTDDFSPIIHTSSWLLYKYKAIRCLLSV